MKSRRILPLRDRIDPFHFTYRDASEYRTLIVRYHEALTVSEKEVSKLKDRLSRCFEWTVEDVQACAVTDYITLPKKDAKIILDRLFRHHDAKKGMNWDVISEEIKNYLNNKNN